MEDSDTLVIAVDELGRLGESARVQNLQQVRRGVFCNAMDVMDRVDNTNSGSLAFVFSALVEEDLQTWRQNSGRTLFTPGAQLTLLDREVVDLTLKRNLRDYDHVVNAEALIQRPRIQGIIQQCFGHPRWVAPPLTHTPHTTTAAITTYPGR